MQDQQRKLLLERRCAWCAEPATVDVLLRGGQCGHCGRTSPSADPEKLKEVLGTVRTHWKKQRAWAYGGLAIATLVTGWLPLVSSFVMVAVLIYLRVTLLRRPLAWFGTARRFTSGFLLRLWLTAVGVAAAVTGGYGCGCGHGCGCGGGGGGG